MNTTEPFTLPDVPGVSVVFRRADADPSCRKCARCWKYLPEVDSDPMFAQVCNRCASALHQMHYDIAHGIYAHLPPSLMRYDLAMFEATFVRPEYKDK